MDFCSAKAICCEFVNLFFLLNFQNYFRQKLVFRLRQVQTILFDHDEIFFLFTSFLNVCKRRVRCIAIHPSQSLGSELCQVPVYVWELNWTIRWGYKSDRFALCIFNSFIPLSFARILLISNLEIK